MRTPQEIAEEMRRLKQRFNTNDMVYEGTLEDLKSQYLTSEQEADAKLEQLNAQADTAFEAWSGIDIAGNRDLDALIDEVSQLTITGTPPPPPPPPPATVPPEYLALVDAALDHPAHGLRRALARPWTSRRSSRWKTNCTTPACCAQCSSILKTKLGKLNWKSSTVVTWMCLPP